MSIPWFIFSDGEAKTINNVTAALSTLGLSMPHNHVFVLPGGRDIEQYLIHEGYQAQSKAAVIAFEVPSFTNENHKQAKTKEIIGWTDLKLIEYLTSHKTKLSPHWAESIASLTDDRRIPGEVRKLFAAIDSVLTPACEVKREG